MPGCRTGPHESGGLIEQKFVGFAASGKLFFCHRVCGHPCHLRHAPVSQSIFQGFRHRFVPRIHVIGNVTVFTVEVHAAFIPCGRLFYGFKGLQGVLRVSFQYHVRQDRNPGISHHAIRFVVHQVPDRQLSLLLIYIQHGLQVILHFLRVNDRGQRMGRPVGVPERERGIFCKAVRQISITEQGWGHHGVIQGSIKYHFSLRIACSVINF